MAVERGVMFRLQTMVDPGADRAFTAMEDRVRRLQGMMGSLRLGVHATASASTLAGSPGASSSTAGRAASADDDVLRAAQRRRADMRRAADERERLHAEKTARQVERANREALDQQIKDLRRAEAEKQKIRQQADRDLQRRIGAGNRQLNQLVRSGTQAQSHDQRLEARDEARRIQLGNRQLATLVRTGPQAQRQDQQRAERAERHSAREQEIALARQREGYHRLTESIGGSVEAITRLGEGAAYLGLIGQRDLGHLTDSLLRIRGIANVVTGGIRSAGDIGGLVRNLRGVHATGGMGGIGRALMGLGPRAAAAGGASGLGAVPGGITAAFSAPAGIIVGGIAAAVALAADQALNSGRFTKGIGRSVGRGITRAYGMAHSLGNTLETLGMEEGERREIERRRLTTLEGYEGRNVFSAAAAAERNTERMQIMSSQRQQQRSVFRQIGRIGLGGEFDIAAREREREDSQADIDRRLHMAYLRSGITPYFLGTRNRYGVPGKSAMRSPGHTGIGELTGAFATGSVFSSANVIRDHTERMRFLQGLRDRRAENLESFDRIGQQMKSLNTQEHKVVNATIANRNSDNPDPKAERQAAEELERIDQRRKQLARETAEISRRMYLQDVQDAAKLVEFAKQRSGAARGRLAGAAERFRSAEEHLGSMNPLQVASVAQAMRRIEAAKNKGNVTPEDIELADMGGAKGRELARQAREARGRASPDADYILSFERADYQGARQSAARERETALEMGKRLEPSTNQFTIDGGYHVTVDIRDDMQIAENMHAFEASIEQKFRDHDKAIFAAIRAAVDEASRNVHEQQRNTSK